MKNVLRQIVLAGGDEDLGAGDAIAAVRHRLGLGADEAEIGAALRLGQAHGASPAAVDELGQIVLLQFLRAVQVQRVIGALAEARKHAEG